MKKDNLKKSFVAMMLATVSTLGILISSTTSYATTDPNGGLKLGLEAYRSSGYSYQTGLNGSEKILWKIASYNQAGTVVNKDRAIYCLKGGPGFGSGTSMGDGSVVKRDYTEYFNLKDLVNIPSPYKDVLPSGANYNSLVWVLEHCYVPAPSQNATTEQTELAAEYRKILLTNAGIPNSKISDDEIDIAQQLAVWHFTNEDVYHLDIGDLFSLWIKDTTDSRYMALGDKFTSNGDERNDDTIALFNYFVRMGTANASTVPVIEDKTKFSLTANNIQVNTVQNNYIIGPFKIENLSKTNYQLEGNLVAADGNTKIDYTYVDAQGNALNKTLTELVGTEFYLAVDKTQSIAGVNFKVNVVEYTTDITYWSVSGSTVEALKIDQPVAEVVRKKQEYTLETPIDYTPIFDLALRKFITKINDNTVVPSREPVVNATSITNGVTTAIKEHTKQPLYIKTGDTILYTIRIYNEGNVNGYAKAITDYLPEGLELKTNSQINTENGWTNPSGDGKTIVTEKLKDTLLTKFNGTTLAYADVQVECVVTATVSENNKTLKNIAEITKHSDESGNEQIKDVDSTPNDLTDDQKQNYNPGESEKGWGYEDDDDYEDLILAGKKFDLALRKFITKINNNVVDPSREPVVDIAALKTGSTTAIKEHTKTPLYIETGDTILYTIRIYNEGEINGYAKEITDYLPAGLELKTNSQINTDNGWTNPSGDGKTIVTNKLAGTLLEAFNGTTLDYADVQVECVVTATVSENDKTLKNIAEITKHSDESGNEQIKDVDSTPNDLTDDQKQNYNPGESEKGWGYEDDDDYEDLVLAGKVFDLALRKFITNINGKELIDTTTGKYLREPTIDVSPLVNKTGTTANYRHPKDPVGVSVGDIVIYTIRVYNEGEIDGYASSVTDYLPPQLEFVTDDEENFNATYGWVIDSSLRKATTNYLAKSEIDPEDNLLKAFDKDTMTIPDYKELKIKCRVKSTKDLDKVITNIAEITDFTDKDGNPIRDRDSEKSNVNLPTDEHLPDYKGNESNKSILSDKDYFYKGQEDDDDFEKLILEEFDLALRKFITGVNDTPVTNRIPVFTNVKDENGNYIYEHTKEPIEVETTDIVEYTIRIYNEGDISGYAKLVKDNIPSGLEFLPENQRNIDYRWKMLKEDGTETNDVKEAKYITTDYLSKEQEKTAGENLIKAFDPTTMESPDYRDVKVVFKVVAPNSYDQIITNIAEIADDSDEDGNPVEDKDSTPDNGEEKEDDIDKEHIKLSYFDLALRKFITGVNDTSITNRIPVFKIDENGNYVYEHTKEPVEVENGNIVTYTLRIFNEGTKAGYASSIKDDLPEGLLFLPENETNKEYRWVMLDKDGNKTEKVEEAVAIQTDYLSKEQEDTTGRNNLLKPFDSETMEQPDYRDVKIAFKVTEPNTSDRILINKAQIADDQDKDGNPVVDKDSTPDKWIDGEDDQDIEKVKVKYFDLALRKWVTQAIVIEDGKETITETGHKAEDDPEAPVKVEIVQSKLNKVVVKFRYKIRVTNEGEIAGYAKEISDYIPEGLKFVAADNPNWKQVDGKVVTDQLKDKLLQPGESAEVEILLTWINSGDNLGLKVNIAEISKDYNDSNTPDIDSTPDNEKPGEDDIDDAPVILSIKTGFEAIKGEYIALAASALIIISAGVIFIKKYVL